MKLHRISAPAWGAPQWLGIAITTRFRGAVDRILALVCLASALVCIPVRAGQNVYLTEVPDYDWFAGCFGTGTGNLMGYWDRHGFPNFYTGPTGNGLAPLNSFGPHEGIRSLWATQAGIDGRPSDKPGHIDDYWHSYASTAPDPHVIVGRPEHSPDCLGDFIGLSQRKWTNLNGECDGNIDAYSFVYWDNSGARRVNFTPGPEAGSPARDIQSGLRAWTEYRGSRADVFTQLADFNPETPPGKGFTFEDLKTEIDTGYPVLAFLQTYHSFSRSFPEMERGNPLIHAVLIYGYYVTDDGIEYARIRTSFAGGDNVFAKWQPEGWWGPNLPLRGVIGYHPKPQITRTRLADGQITIEWEGPDSELYNAEAGTRTKLHYYQIEMATSLAEGDFVPVSDPTTTRSIVITMPERPAAYFRVILLPRSGTD